MNLERQQTQHRQEDYSIVSRSKLGKSLRTILWENQTSKYFVMTSQIRLHVQSDKWIHTLVHTRTRMYCIGA